MNPATVMMNVHSSEMAMNARPTTLIVQIVVAMVLVGIIETGNEMCLMN
jgi:hypothetical protein